jgi:hypothetical protein
LPFLVAAEVLLRLDVRVMLFPLRRGRLRGAARYQLLLPDWCGYLLAWLALVAVANVYQSAYSRLCVEIHKDRAETREVETLTRHTG